MHMHNIKTRVLQLDHNFGLRSAVEHRVWDHLQYKAFEELEKLMKIIGKCALCGRRQNLLSKEVGCYSPLNLNGIMNYALADVDVEAILSRRNLKLWCGFNFL